MSAPSPVGKENPERTASGYTSTLRRGRAGGAFAGPGRRAPHQGGRCALLAGICPGGKEQAVVGRVDQRTPRPRTDPYSTYPGESVWAHRADLASNRWPCQLRIQALHVFRKPLRTGKVGRPRLVLPATVMIEKVKKRYQRRRVVEVIRRVVVGCEAEVISRVIGTQRSIRALINTAYIERLNATFRARLVPLVRRTRAGARKQTTLEAGVWLVGGCYNFVWAHCTLGEGRTLAMAAQMTDHRWSTEELLRYPVPPAELPKWRGRKPRWLLEAERAA